MSAIVAVPLRGKAKGSSKEPPGWRCRCISCRWLCLWRSDAQTEARFTKLHLHAPAFSLNLEHHHALCSRCQAERSTVPLEASPPNLRSKRAASSSLSNSHSTFQSRPRIER